MPTLTIASRSEEHTSELQSQSNLVCRLLLETKKQRGFLRGNNTQRNSTTPDANRIWEVLNRLEYVVAILHVQLGVRPGRLTFFVFFEDSATTEIYTLSLHDALPI